MTLRLLAFLVLAGLAAALWFASNSGGQGNLATADLRLTPQAAKLQWPDTLRGIPLLAPTPAPNETPSPIRLDAPMPDCAPLVETPIAPPMNFPPFPILRGARFYKSSLLNDNPNYMLVAAYVPMTLSDSTRYLIEAVPQAGYVLGNGDSEPGEAESAFADDKWRGGFRVSSLWDCEGVSDWVIVVIRK